MTTTLARVLKPPKRPPIKLGGYRRKSVFLAGSIEMGTAVDWQTRLTTALEDMDIDIFNPRRDDWDSSWVQSVENEKFAEQVNWELARLEEASLIVLYFDPATKSPISLLEFGLYAKERKLVVFCPEGFWRKGNVDLVCRRYNIIQVTCFDELVKEAREWLK